MDVSRDLELFRKLILCSDGVWSWRYDAQGNLLSSDCPQEALFATAFSVLGCKEQMLAGAAKADVPVTLGTSVGLIWGPPLNGRTARCAASTSSAPSFTPNSLRAP